MPGSFKYFFIHLDVFPGGVLYTEVFFGFPHNAFKYVSTKMLSLEVKLHGFPDAEDESLGNIIFEYKSASIDTIMGQMLHRIRQATCFSHHGRGRLFSAFVFESARFSFQSTSWSRSC